MGRGPAALARALPGGARRRVLLPEAGARRTAARDADESDPAREGRHPLRRRRETRDAARAREPRLHRGARLGKPRVRAASARLALLRPRSGRGGIPLRPSGPRSSSASPSTGSSSRRTRRPPAGRGSTSSCRSGSGPDADEVLAFAREVGRRLAAAHPEELTVEARIAKRRGRLYLDAARNGFAQTVVTPYSIRVRPGAPVSTPLAWSEVQAVARPGEVPPRQLRAAGSRRPDPWAGFWQRRQALPRLG